MQMMQSFGQQQQQAMSPGLASTISHEGLEELLTKLSPEEKQSMIDNLPEGQQTEEHLRSNLLSP